MSTIYLQYAESLSKIPSPLPLPLPLPTPDDSDQIPHLAFDQGLHVAAEVVHLHAVLALLLLQLLLDALQVVDLLRQLRHAVRMLLAQRGRRGLVLQRALLQVPPQLLELRLALLAQLHLRRRRPARLLQPLADLLQLPGEVSALLLHLGARRPLRLDLFLQLLTAGLARGAAEAMSDEEMPPKNSQ